MHNEGEVRVEVLGDNGEPMPGFTLSDSVPLRGAGVAQVVGWHDANWARLAGKTIAIRIQLRSADLYSFHVRRVQR